MSSDAPPPSPGQDELSLEAFPSESVHAEPREPQHVLLRVLTFALGLLVAAQLLTWIPHYATWPWWTDHDVFASAARAWDEGMVPYQDYRLNNFPGTIYLFWAIGTLFGWGQTAPLYLFDAVL
ncbi:MAG: hypothetical protein AB7P22_20765, partial [Vicinamibacterales bacterium]